MREIGQTSPEDGRYRCSVCGAEVQMHAGEQFPACPDKDHTPKWILSSERVLTLAGAGR